MRRHALLKLLIVTLQVLWTLGFVRSDDKDLEKFLSVVNERLAELYNKEVLANWQNEIMGPNDLVALLQSDIATKEIMNYVQMIMPEVQKFKFSNITNDVLKRQLAQIPEAGYEALSPNEIATMYAVTANMSDIYKQARLCSFIDRKKCELTLIPNVQNILHSSKNVEEIEYYWLEWRQKTGLAARENFVTFVELYRRAAKLNGFSKASDFWFKDFEENHSKISVLMEKLMGALRPLFLQFHAHVRNSLRKQYGVKLVPVGKPYPQNLAEIFIGNAYRKADPVWYIDFPYPDIVMPNITAGILMRGLNTPQRIFWNVADYFRSLGFPQFEHDFWSNNVRPKADTDDEYDTCWHKAWKYYGLRQVNLSYCTDVNEEKFFNMFEAITDLYYYRAYQSKPTLFQEEPFPNFGDALEKVLSLAASSPVFLEKFKLIGEGFTTEKARINRLYLLGLRTVFLLPVFYLLDRYRVDVLDGRIDIYNNCAFWDLTELYTGAEPPFVRSNKDFDAPAKLLMEVDDQYTSQIMSTVLQFQLYKHFCEITGQYKKNDPRRPLDLCDLSNQREVGPILLRAMSMGSSKSYREVLRAMTNETELKMDGLIEYFQPLYDWLVEDNRKHNIEIGWEKSYRCVG